MAKKIQLDLKEVERLASIGCTEEQIAQNLGVGRATIQRRKRDCDAFDAAYRKGRSSCIVEVTNALYDSAVGDKPNVLAQKTLLERIAGPAQVEITASLELHHHHKIDDAIALLDKAGFDLGAI